MSIATATGKTPSKLQFRLSTFILLCGGGPAAAWLLYLLMPIEVWDGRFDLAIHLQSKSGRRIESVEYEAFFRRDHAEFTVAHQPEGFGGFREAEYWSGVWHCHVASTGRRDIFGRELRYMFARFVVLLIRYDNGEELLQIAEVPEGRGPRSMTVDVP